MANTPEQQALEELVLRPTGRSNRCSMESDTAICANAIWDRLKRKSQTEISEQIKELIIQHNGSHDEILDDITDICRNLEEGIPFYIGLLDLCDCQRIMVCVSKDPRKREGQFIRGLQKILK